MSEREIEFWNEFKEKYGKVFKKKALIENGVYYININLLDVIPYKDSSNNAILCGDIAEYIYDLEEIKEESLLMFNKYDRLEKENIKLKAKISLLKQINEVLRHEEEEE